MPFWHPHFQSNSLKYLVFPIKLTIPILQEFLLTRIILRQKYEAGNWTYMCTRVQLQLGYFFLRWYFYPNQFVWYKCLCFPPSTDMAAPFLKKPNLWWIFLYNWTSAETLSSTLTLKKQHISLIYYNLQ